MTTAFAKKETASAEDQNQIISSGPEFQRLMYNLKAPCQKETRMDITGLRSQILANATALLLLPSPSPPTMKPIELNLIVRRSEQGYKAVVLELENGGARRKVRLEGPEGRDVGQALEMLLEVTAEMLGEVEGEWEGEEEGMEEEGV